MLIVFASGTIGVGMIGYQTYHDAPVTADFRSQSGAILISKSDIEQGQTVFLRYALMEYGSMFGDGALRGPDFTAEALHHTALFMNEFYAGQRRKQLDRELNEYEVKAIEARVQAELKENRYDESRDAVMLTEGQSYAINKLTDYYRRMFLHPAPDQAFPPPGFISDTLQLRQLAAFFYWGSWVCAAERPGEDFSYTHNWPYDPLAGNVASPAVTFWSVIGILGFILGLGAVLYYYGQMDSLSDKAYTDDATPILTSGRVERFAATESQRASYKFFFAAALVFLVQVISGALTINGFTDYLGVFGIDLSALLPMVISRSWHVLLSVFWIATCWIGCSIFVLPLLAQKEVQGQRRLINILFWSLIVMVGGSMLGIYLGPMGLAGEWWYWFGNQGWEFVELGKAYQIMLLLELGLWCVIMYRGAKPAFVRGKPWELPNWLVYSTITISCLFLSGFVATPTTSFVIADFWRWCVVHMWAEAFFEVFTTIVVAYLMVIMGLVGRKSATRIVYLATLLFLGSGFLGISHNFYWNAKPVATMALGSIFSTLQVVPLILLTLEAWRFRNMPHIAMRTNGKQERLGIFALPGVFLFLIAVNFWNFFGAGVFGLIINLPIVNYYEHGTYLTVNHGHAALFGVYGNISLAGMLFCCRLVFKPGRWNARLVKNSFWALNIGLLLMVLMDLFPVGAIQLNTVIEKGYWYARSNDFVSGSSFTTLTWMRAVGGILFLFGGVVPLVWFVVSRAGALKKVGATIDETTALVKKRVEARTVAEGN